MKDIALKNMKNGVEIIVTGKKRVNRVRVLGNIEKLECNTEFKFPTHKGKKTPKAKRVSLKNTTVGSIIAIELTNGETVDFVATEDIDGFIRFDSRDCIAGIKTKWNSGGTNDGGYYASTVRKCLEEEIWNLLPDRLKNIIVDTKRLYLDGEEKKTYTAKVFLPTASEVFEPEECYGDNGLYKQMEYYKDRRNRMKGERKGEDTAYWWLASAYSGNPSSACIVSSYGYPNNSNVSYPYCGVPVCFRIKK